MLNILRTKWRDFQSFSQHSPFTVSNDMVICGHQFNDDNITDWIMNSSASFPLDSYSNASKILHGLIQEHFAAADARKLNLAIARHREERHSEQKKSRAPRSRVRSFFNFKGFEDSEHLEGCPVKWLFRQQSTGSNRISSVRSTTSGNSTRDRTPSEIQIRKINLKTNRESDADNLDEKKHKQRRAKLALKLNWKEFNEEAETNLSSVNYLPSRSLTLYNHPWLIKVLLSPRNESCCPKPLKPGVKEIRPRAVPITSISLPEMHEKHDKVVMNAHGNKKLKKNLATSQQMLTIRLDPIMSRQVPSSLYSNKSEQDEIQVISSRVVLSKRPVKSKSSQVLTSL